MINTRKFIISDIHGNGNLYYPLMSYLENISKEEAVTLYINGDLIDRGMESGEILLDVIKRINNNDKSFKIVYLGGNHEHLMHLVFDKRRKSLYVNEAEDDWYRNKGWVTDYALSDILQDKDKILEVADFVGNLDLYHKFPETINGKPILLVHACCPDEIKDKCDIKVNNDHIYDVYHIVWTREKDSFIPFRVRIGNPDYFTIIGHTPVNSKFGYEFNESSNYLNIDGGSAKYVSGLFEFDHYPLVEIKDGYLKILTFNNNNEIIYGNYFTNNESIPMDEKDLDKSRKYLDASIKPKRLVRLKDGIIGYEDWDK